MEDFAPSCVKDNGCFSGLPDPCNRNDGLTDYSPREKPWDVHRGQADDVGGVYAAAVEFERYAARMDVCSGVLRFGWTDDPEIGRDRLRLSDAFFCRVRHCPVCQWRRSLMWQARFYQSLPDLVGRYPRARWLFLTLTVRNCPIGALGETLASMNTGWGRLVKRQEFRPVTGWVRTTEVTRGGDGSAHPHFHALLMVPPSWFTRDYVKQARWMEVWQECLRVDYAPNVDIRTVKAVPKGDVSSVATTVTALQGAVAETLKYAIKPDDMVADDDWFLELTRQTHRRRFVASGGALRDVLRAGEETNADLAAGDSAPQDGDEGPRLAFRWRSGERRYRRFPKGDG